MPDSTGGSWFPRAKYRVLITLQRWFDGARFSSETGWRSLRWLGHHVTDGHEVRPAEVTYLELPARSW